MGKQSAYLYLVRVKIAAMDIVRAKQQVVERQGEEGLHFPAGPVMPDIALLGIEYGGRSGSGWGHITPGRAGRGRCFMIAPGNTLSTREKTDG